MRLIRFQLNLAENVAYGIDNIEKNWKEYNGSTVEYSIDFDSTIIKFQMKVEELNEAKDGVSPEEKQSDDLDEDTKGGQKGGQKNSTYK